LLLKINFLSQSYDISLLDSVVCTSAKYVSFEFNDDKLYLKIAVKKGRNYGGKETDF
jgi:hypothetical protein